MNYTVQTPQGLATATSLGGHILNGTAGASVRERWQLSLRLGDVAISQTQVTLGASKMSESWLADWASLQSAEGYAANQRECRRLINLVQRHG